MKVPHAGMDPIPCNGTDKDERASQQACLQVVAICDNGLLPLLVLIQHTACATAGQTHPFIHSIKGALAEWAGSVST